MRFIALILCVLLSWPVSAQVAQTGAGLGKPATGGGGSCAAAFTAGPAVSHSGITATFSSQSIGAADPTRIVVVAFQANTSGTGLTFSATIGGSAATQAVQEHSAVDQVVAIWYLAVSSGTTANIVITAAGSSPNFNEAQIAVYSVTNCATNPSGGASVGTTAWGVVAPGTMVVTATLPTSGVGIGVFGTDRAVAPTWTTGTLNFHQNDSAGTGDDIYAVSIAGTGSKTLTSTSVTTTYNAAMATWGP